MAYFETIRDGLKRDWPAKYHVSVRTYKRLPVHGDCEFRGDHFRIRIERAQLTVMVDTLLHEWAHAIEWRRRNSRTYHHVHWARKYAELYQWWERLDV